MATRPLTVDAHHHWMPPDHVRFVERYLREGESATRRDGVLSVARDGVAVHNIDETRAGDAAAHFRDMDAAGIDAAVFSLGLWCEWLTLPMAREVNDELAEVQAQSDGRIIALAHVPPLEDGAESELHRAVLELGLRGVNLTTHWQGEYLDSQRFRPFFRTIARLDVPVVVHGSTTPGSCPMLDDYGLGPVLGRVVDHTAIVARVLASGLLEELPSLRIVLPQLGGGFFAIKRRIGFGEHAQGLTRYANLLDRLWFDTAPAVWEPIELTCAVANLGARRLLFGSDYPVRSSWLGRAAEAMQATPMSDGERQAIMGGNAADLFRL